MHLYRKILILSMRYENNVEDEKDGVLLRCWSFDALASMAAAGLSVGIG